jgi:outer membrane protein
MKKIFVLMLLVLAMGLQAQEIKIAVVNTQKIMTAMPDISEVESQLATMGQQYEKELKAMNDEYTRKYAELQSQSDSLTDNIRMMRLQELNDIQARAENFAPQARDHMQKKQEELMAPIREKIQKAIKEVGEENGYTYILEPSIILYMSPSAVDATDKVKTKLGIK